MSITNAAKVLFLIMVTIAAASCGYDCYTEVYPHNPAKQARLEVVMLIV